MHTDLHRVHWQRCDPGGDGGVRHALLAHRPSRQVQRVLTQRQILKLSHYIDVDES